MSNQQHILDCNATRRAKFIVAIQTLVFLPAMATVASTAETLESHVTVFYLNGVITAYNTYVE